MKVRVLLTVDVDPALWDNGNYLDRTTGRVDLAAVREDVRTHVLHQIHGSFLVEEANGTVTLGGK